MPVVFRVWVNTSRPAFGSGRAAELARIFRELADDIEEGHDAGALQAADGEACGAWWQENAPAPPKEED